MYDYETEKPFVFTDEGQRKCFEIKINADKLIKKSGVVTVEKILGSGSTWRSLACIDRLVEMGLLRYCGETGSAGQCKILTSTGDY